MIPASFEYNRAASIEAAIAALGDGDSKILAGGHSLLPAMKLRLNQPGRLIDISSIEALKQIYVEDGELVIGAGATHGSISRHELVIQHLPFFAEGARWIGDRQVRNRGTIGGSLAHADPAADWGAMVLAANAGIEVQGPKGRRRIEADDFFVGLFTTALAEDEIITAIRIPIPPEGSSGSYQKFVQPASRFAIVGCAVLLADHGDIRIAFAGVSEAPFRDRDAEGAYNLAGIDTAVEQALKNVDNVMSDHYASANYRRHLAKVYLRKALKAIQ